MLHVLPLSVLPLPVVRQSSRALPDLHPTPYTLPLAVLLLRFPSQDSPRLYTLHPTLYTAALPPPRLSPHSTTPQYHIQICVVGGLWGNLKRQENLIKLRKSILNHQLNFSIKTFNKFRRNHIVPYSNHFYFF